MYAAGYSVQCMNLQALPLYIDGVVYFYYLEFYGMAKFASITLIKVNIPLIVRYFRALI